MKKNPQSKEPKNANYFRENKPVIAYPTDNLPLPNLSHYQLMREKMVMVDKLVVPPREAATFTVSAGNFFRIVSTEGPQVGDLNLWNRDNLDEHFYVEKQEPYTERT